jgi:hypothetical protein
MQNRLQVYLKEMKMSYKLTETQIADGWVLFKDRFPTGHEVQRGRYVNVLYGDGTLGVEEVNLKTKVIVSLSMNNLVAWQTPRPVKYDKQEAYTAIEYGGDGLWAVKRNADGFIRAWDIPGEHHAKRIAEEYNLAKKERREAHERQV